MSQAMGLKLTLKSYGKRKPFGLEVQKDCFADEIATEDLVDGTT